jgi:hypothetical protein
MENEHKSVEAAQTLQHVRDIADLLAERLRVLPEAEAEAFLEAKLAQLAVLARKLEDGDANADVGSIMGYTLSAVLRTRVEDLLKRR